MTNRDALNVTEPSGSRWELAKSLLRSGEAPVAFGNVQMWRSVSGPNADGQIGVSVFVSDQASELSAREALREAHEAVDGFAAMDPEFAGLLDSHGSRWELVHDYGMGSVLITAEDADGNLVWPPDRLPR